MAEKKVAVSLDLLLNELKNVRVENLSSAPQQAVPGRMYFNTGDKTLYYGADSQWNPIATGGSVEEALKSLKLYCGTQNGETYTMYLYTGDSPIGSNLFGAMDATAFMKNASISEVIRFVGQTTTGVGTYNSTIKTYTTANGRVFSNIDAGKNYLGIVVDNYSTGAFSSALADRYRTFSIPLDTQDGFNTLTVVDTKGKETTVLAKEHDHKFSFASTEDIAWEYEDGELIATIGTVKSNLIDGLSLVLSGTTLSLKDSSKSKTFASVALTQFAIDGMQEGAALLTATGTTGAVTVNEEEYTVSGLTIGRTYIVFVWNTQAGKQPMALDVTTLMNVYKNGNGLSLTDDTFSIELASDCDDYLTVDGNGLKLSGVKSDITKLSSSVDDLDTKISNNEGSIKGLEKDINGLKGINAHRRKYKAVPAGQSSITISEEEFTIRNVRFFLQASTAGLYDEIEVQVQQKGHPSQNPQAVTVSWSGISVTAAKPAFITYETVGISA